MLCTHNTPPRSTTIALREIKSEKNIEDRFRVDMEAFWFCVLVPSQGSVLGLPFGRGWPASSLLPPTSSLHQPPKGDPRRCQMESERDEELRVLFAAAEKGRADIVNTVVEALVSKPKAATAAAAGAMSHSIPGVL